jgi:hypothetical protein
MKNKIEVAKQRTDGKSLRRRREEAHARNVSTHGETHEEDEAKHSRNRISNSE